MKFDHRVDILIIMLLLMLIVMLSITVYEDVRAGVIIILLFSHLLSFDSLNIPVGL